MPASDHISARQAGSLSEEDFHNLATKADPGYSVRAFGSNVGSSPTDAYMVSHSEHNAPVMPHASVTGATIKDFVNSREAALSQPSMYAGAWTKHATEKYPTETGAPADTYLDVSEALPRTHAGRAAAISRGVATGEKAIGVINELGHYANEINLEKRDPLKEWSSTFMEDPEYVIGQRQEELNRK